MDLSGVYSQEPSKGFILQNIMSNKYTAKLTNTIEQNRCTIAVLGYCAAILLSLNFKGNGTDPGSFDIIICRFDQM